MGIVANIVTTRTNVTSKKVRVTNTNGSRLNARKPKHPPELPRMGTRVLEEEARGVAKVEPPTPRGGNSPGVERPGPQKEEETAAERSDEGHVNTMDQHGPDGEGHDGREKGSGRKRSKRKSGQHVEPGRGQLGEQRTRAGTSGGEAALERSVWSSRRKKRRRRQESTRGKGCVHESQGRWRARTRRAREG